jgi:hypothetical protein
MSIGEMEIFELFEARNDDLVMVECCVPTDDDLLDVGDIPEEPPFRKMKNGIIEFASAVDFPAIDDGHAEVSFDPPSMDSIIELLGIDCKIDVDDFASKDVGDNEPMTERDETIPFDLNLLAERAR